VADQAQHVTTGRRNRTCARCISTIRELVNRTLAKNVLTRRQEDCASKAQDCRMIRGAVLPVDKIRRTAQITGQATTIGEVLGRHVGNRELLTGPEAPVQLLQSLVVQTIYILDATRSIACTRSASPEETNNASRSKVTVCSGYTGYLSR